MDMNHVINFCMYGLLALLVYTVYILRVNKDGLQHTVDTTPTTMVFNYSAFGVKGRVVVAKDDVTLKPSITRNMEEWIILLPLDYTYEQFMDYIRYVDVPPDFSADGFKGVLLLVDILDRRIEIEDESIYDDFNESIYLFSGKNHKRYFMRFNKSITNKRIAFD